MGNPKDHLSVSRSLTKRIVQLLTRAYGPRTWKCWGRGIDVLVETILSQNTSDTNSSAGFKQLRRRFNSWNKVADADVNEVERHIRIAGLSRQKAPRIQAILRAIRDDRGKIDLQFLHELDEQTAYDYLTRFKGVGPKTANCVLLFAFGKTMFPVDTHIHRIARRLELTPPRASAEDAHEILLPMIAPKDRYPLHVLLIEHGRKTCRAINPKCDVCVLKNMCPFGQLRLSQGATSSPSGRGRVRGHG